MMKKFIGIDLSLNSTAICIITEGRAKIISIFKTEKNIDKIFEKQDHFSLIEKCEDAQIILEKKEKDTNQEYHTRERHKILSFINLSEKIIDSIKREITKETYIAMEGISFGSTGNSLIDISMITGILRKDLVNNIGGSAERLFVFSPTTIKKFAGKGSFKKIEMFESIIKEKEINSDFIKAIRDNKDLCVTEGGVVKKPIEDMVDSIWVAKFLKSLVGGY